MDNEKINGYSSIFRLITPILVTIAIFMVGNLQGTVKDINEKLFRHLTNDELHPPRSFVVDKSEFLMYQKMRDKQMDKIDDCLAEIKDMLKRAPK